MHLHQLLPKKSSSGDEQPSPSQRRLSPPPHHHQEQPPRPEQHPHLETEQSQIRHHMHKKDATLQQQQHEQNDDAMKTKVGGQDSSRLPVERKEACNDEMDTRHLPPKNLDGGSGRKKISRREQNMGSAAVVRSAIGTTDDLFPQQVPRLSKSEELHKYGLQNLQTKDEIDDMAEIKNKERQHWKGLSAIANQRTDSSKKGKDSPTTQNTDEMAMVKEKARQANASPQLMYFGEDEEDQMYTATRAANPRMHEGRTTRGSDETKKAFCPALIVIEDNEEDEDSPVTEPHPRDVQADGPLSWHNSRRRSTNSANNAPIITPVNNVSALPEAILVDESVGRKASRFSWKILLGIALILIVASVIIGLLLKSGDGSEGSPTLLPTETLVPADEGDVMRDFLSSVSPSSTQNLVNESSPQYLAMRWLMDDSVNISYTVLRKIQRWVLATIYYSTSGMNWTDSVGWLDENHECSWKMAAAPCEDEQHISKLYLFENNLAGTIPLEIGLLSDSLISIDFKDNRINGRIPTNIAFLTKLMELDLVNNSLTGSIPSEVGLLSSVEMMHFGYNKLSGPIPKEIGLAKGGKLTNLALGYNQLTGSIPSELSLQNYLNYLNLGHNLLGEKIPTELGLLTRLNSILLGYNGLSGTIPTQMGLFTNLENMFDVGHNPLVGTIPKFLGLLTKCKYLHVHNTSMSNGRIPTEFGFLEKVESLNLYQNSITGSIPSQLGRMSNLQYLALYRNNLNGLLPSELGFLTNLIGLNVAYNNITGTIPSSYGKLPNLTYLLVEHNDLVGPVPDALCEQDLWRFSADCGELNCSNPSCCTMCADLK